ncbi:MAG: hypothetical protein MUP76_08885 [Acidimicrobiia bacterium]|nr:hypothetical protein [Acidimicrobiia bacterium]
MRVTKTDGCCGPEYGNDNSIVTDGFVSVALTANITDAEVITVTNANGKTCVRDAGSPTFDGYGVDLTFCEVQPCLFSMITGQPVVTGPGGDVIGFKMNSQIALDSSGFALEVWMGVPGVACEGDSGAAGYLLLPCLSGGVIGDFSVENAAITFSITGASTRDGNAWGSGPYSDHRLPSPLDPNDHLYVVFSTEAIPAETDGCVALIPSGLSLVVNDPNATLTIPRSNLDCWANVVMVDWGDGTAVEEVAPPTPTATHAYTENGSFLVTVSAEGCADISWTVLISSFPPAVAAAPAGRGRGVPATDADGE